VPGTFTVKLRDIRFTGTVRVTLGPLTDEIPCYKAMVLTFLSKPDMHFEIETLGMDVMKLGVGDANLGNKVASTFQSVIESLALFPDVYPVSNKHNIDVNPNPEGLLKVSVHEGLDLKKMDAMGQSDPFVELGLLPLDDPDGYQRTERKDKTLNPKWDQEFWFEVHDTKLEGVAFHVMDKNTTRSDQPMGDAQIMLDELPFNTEKQMVLPLVNVETGKLSVSALMRPLDWLEADHFKAKSLKKVLGQPIWLSVSNLTSEGLYLHGQPSIKVWITITFRKRVSGETEVLYTLDTKAKDVAAPPDTRSRSSSSHSPNRSRSDSSMSPGKNTRKGKDLSNPKPVCWAEKAKFILPGLPDNPSLIQIDMEVKQKVMMGTTVLGTAQTTLQDLADANGKVEQKFFEVSGRGMHGGLKATMKAKLCTKK